LTRAIPGLQRRVTWQGSVGMALSRVGRVVMLAVGAALLGGGVAWAMAEPDDGCPATTSIPDGFPDLRKGRFSGELHLVLLQDKDHPVMTTDGRSLWAIEKAITYRTHAGDIITIPPGMQTDLASIPRLLWTFLPPDGPWAQIAVFHDLLYKTKGSGIWIFQRDGKPIGSPKPSLSRSTCYSRKEADELLREGMSDLGISGARRWAIYNGVRLGGAAGWGR
jgi:hypothetical protein